MEADCEDDNGCTFDYCIDGFCTHPQVDDGPMPGAEQIDGDCMSVACIGGEPGTTINNQDAPDDPNGGDCIVTYCDLAGVPGTRDADDGDQCDINGAQAVCSAGGVCSCAAPTPGAVHYVDPDEGTDSPQNGGAPGACAYATIGYALSQADGEIRLAFGDYVNETFPIVLTGAEWINCPYDQDNDIRPRIAGSGMYQGVTTVMVFNGMLNELDDCELDGLDTAAFGVVVASTAVGGEHFLDEVVIRNATSDGVWVNDTGDQLYVAGSSITQNGGYGINFAAPDKSAFIENSSVVANVAGGVNCAAASPGVQFAGGNISACTGCMNCP
jgi:hypothetical protein